MTDGPVPVLLRGVDRAAFAAGLTRQLRDRGVAVDLSAAGTFVRALAAHPPGTRTELYWTARIALVRRHSDLAAFDALFASLFADAGLGADPHARRRPLPSSDPFAAVPAPTAQAQDGGGLPWATLPAVVGGADRAPADGPAVPHRLPTAAAGLGDVPFEALDERQLALLDAWLGAQLRALPTRRTRRRAVGRRGSRAALRETMARSRRTGWEPIELVRTRPVRRPRRLVLLCDVSRSMQAEATAYLALGRAFVRAADAEVFAFATGLTRLTPVLRRRSAVTAMAQATDAVGDRFGGTRIATNLRALLASRHADLVRGAIVLIGSDGWDSCPATELAAELARVRRRAHRILWINPRAGVPGFQPRVASMAAALPYCDRLLPGATLTALRGVIDAVAECDRPAPGPTRGTARSTPRGRSAPMTSASSSPRPVRTRG
ncbi:VWA domain-containing protein [Actinocatenispora sera]|uniref:vWA domain-containing protein n=1 Tax=Actinocatenispora sera TaxID=390989 RepID=UPI0033EC4017